MKNVYSQQGYDEETPSIFVTNDKDAANLMEMELLVYDVYFKGVKEAGLSESQETQVTAYLEKEQAMMKSSMELQARVESGEIDQASADEEMQAGNIIIMGY